MLTVPEVGLFEFSTPILDVKGTFRSNMSMGWPLYDLHIKSYRRSKLVSLITPIRKVVLTCRVVFGIGMSSYIWPLVILLQVDLDLILTSDQLQVRVYLNFRPQFWMSKGTFRSNMSMGWPLYDLHIKSYRRSKLVSLITPIRKVVLTCRVVFLNRNVKLHLTPRHSASGWPSPQFDFWPMLTVSEVGLFEFSTPLLDVKGTFRSKKSMGWPLYDLHIKT